MPTFPSSTRGGLDIHRYICNGWFGEQSTHRRSLRVLLGQLRPFNRAFDGAWSDFPFLPGAKGERDLRLSRPYFVRDPHGAMKLRPSAELIEFVLPPDRLPLRVGRWEFDLQDRMDAFGERRSVAVV